MKKVLLALAITCLGAQPLNAMDFAYYLFNRFIPIQPKRKTERGIFGMNSMGCPDHITLLNKNEPITDELLLELNPEWKSVKTCSYETKNRILWWALANILKGQAAETLIALAICVGANPNYRTQNDGFTALNHSLDKSDYELTHYLLSKEADPNQEARFSRLPIQLAKTPQLAALLLDYGAEISPKLLETWANSDYPAQMVEFFVAKGALLAPDSEGRTALNHITCRVANADDDEENRIKKIRLLLKAGCNYTLQDHFGNTALHYIKALKSPKICQIFINHHFNSHYARFLTLLLCLKKNPHIPYPSKDIRTIFFKQQVQQPLCNLLNKKDNKGKTAYDIWPVDELNPETCIYESFLRLRQEQNQMNRLQKPINLEGTYE